MKPYFHHTNWLIQQLFPHYIWKKDIQEKIIYLSFDDGPIPELTSWVLGELKKFEAKATFFCVGENIQKHPKIFEQILKEEHQVGNHTFNHLDSWRTPLQIYVENIALCEEKIADFGIKNRLFRPPYGKIRRHHYQAIAQDYQLIMWHVLSGDFDVALSPAVCLQKCLQYTEAGSIVVFHDNIKAQERLYYALPQFLKHFYEKGYQFEKL